MRHLCFVTPGLIDLRAFTTFGFNAKPNTDNPIGFFGTGLKLSVAVIARLGCRVTVLVDGVQHEFYTKETDFRGKSFDVIRMRKRKSLMARWNYQEMPFTTELGKNWEPWQVYRELESNTRDEGGHTLIVDDEEPHGMSFLNDDHRGKTVIIIDQPEIVACHDERETIFLETGELEPKTNGRIEVYDRESNYLFYRGMRVIALDKPSKFTYNITCEQRLTEDRTLYNWNAFWEVRYFWTGCEDEDLVDRLLELDEEKFWEGNIDFDQDSTTFHTTTFEKRVRVKIAAESIGLSRAVTYAEKRNIGEDTDPNVTITRKRSEWTALYEELNSIRQRDYETDVLGWAHGGADLTMLESLMEEITPEETAAVAEVDDDGIPF